MQPFETDVGWRGVRSWTVEYKNITRLEPGHKSNGPSPRRWAGELGIIPGSMDARSYIVVGKGNPGPSRTMMSWAATRSRPAP